MNKNKFIIGLVILAIAMLSCAIPGQVAPTVAVQTSQAQASIDIPKDGDVIPMSPYEIVYHGSDMTEVTQVELAVNSVPVSIQSNPSPGTGFVLMRYTWTPPAAGTYIIQTRAQNDKGEWGPYSSLSITVEAAAPPPQPTLQPTSENILAPTPSNTANPTLSIPTLKPGGVGSFTSLSKSTDKFYYGSASCGPKVVNFSVNINNPSGIRYVFIFVRLDDKASDAKTEWDDGKYMSSIGSGNYTVAINSESDIPLYTSYPEAWLGYQFVIQQPDGNLVRSQVYYDITLAKCP
ncbi:MAG: hypothetical protein WCF08_10235 [Anaerolineaceae bacterium]